MSGYGAATDVFEFDDIDGFTHTFTLPDGSSVKTVLEFVTETTPGSSRSAPGAGVSFGNPDALEFDAEVIAATGVFAGMAGTGTAVLRQAGNVDQVSLSLDLTSS